MSDALDFPVESRRLVSDVSTHHQRYLIGAETYVDQLNESMKNSLFNKPFDVADPKNYFLEMYQVLTLIAALELKPQSVVIEVGSGSGWITEIIARLGHSVTCVEPSLAMIEIAQERLKPYLMN